MNQIQKLLCYSGLEVQDYRDCQPEIEEENRRKMHVYLNMACGLLFAITCLSGGIGVLREHSLLYCIALVVCAGLRVVDLMFPDQNGLLLRWLMYAFAAMLYALGIAEAVHAPVVTAVACMTGNDGVGFALQVNGIVLYDNHRIPFLCGKRAAPQQQQADGGECRQIRNRPLRAHILRVLW